MHQFLVKVYRMEAGRAVRSDIKLEKRFNSPHEARCYIDRFNLKCVNDQGRQVAVAEYVGKIDSRTGQLV